MNSLGFIEAPFLSISAMLAQEAANAANVRILGFEATGSINRIGLEAGKTWWVEEEMVLREDLAFPADALVTHPGPSWLSPPNMLVEGFIRSEEAIGCHSLR